MLTRPASDEIVGRHEYTVGRPHPMIDGTLRKQRILAESQDPEIAILLLDFILGYNASLDPAGELRDAIQYAGRIARRKSGEGLLVGFSGLAVCDALCTRRGRLDRKPVGNPH